MDRRKKRTASNLSSSSSEVTASEWRGPCKIHLLPPDIIIDILSRLPIKTILYCRRVCKDWLRLISHPRFVELQLARSSPAILIKTKSSTKNSCNFSLTYVEQRGRAKRLDKLVLTPRNLPSSRFRLVNSCNGLLCLSKELELQSDSIMVCNPILEEYVTIPLPRKRSSCGSFTALGYCSVANRYKLLQTFNPKDRKSKNDRLDAEIYDMDSGTWRSIGPAPCDYARLPINSLLRGSLHWVRPSGKGGEFIYSFNFETEEFGSVPPPPCLDLDESPRHFFDFYSLRLGVVEGCLFVCVFENDSSEFDIWVMKDYGVKESWTKQFVIHNIYLDLLCSDFYEPIKFFNNGEILMLHQHIFSWDVVCYKTQTKTFHGTSITRNRNFELIAHTPSLVSLYHVAKGELVKRVQGSRKECAKFSAEGTIDCAGFGSSANEPVKFNSSLDQGHPGVTFHLQNPDERTE